MIIHVIGATGLIGSSLCKHLKQKGIQYLSYGRSKYNDVIIDISNEDEVNRKLKVKGGDIVINLAAIAQPGLVFKEPNRAYEINVNANKYVVNKCADVLAKYFYMSSVEVFDGKNRAYTEHEEKKPMNEYGRQKAEAEDYIEKRYKSGSLIGRTSWNISSENKGRCFIEYMIDMISTKGARIAVDNWFTISSSQQTSELIVDACFGLESGIIHIASPKPISRLIVADMIANKLSISNKTYESCRFRDITFVEPRSQYNILDVRKSIELLNAVYAAPEELIDLKLKMIREEKKT